MWDLKEFEKLVNNKNTGGTRSSVGVFQKKSSLSSLMSLLRSKSSNSTYVLKAVRAIPLPKRKKYAEALEYLVWNYPNLTLDLPRDQPNIARSRFGDLYHPGHGDLIYGIHPGRCQMIYRDQSQQFCDEYNNHFGVGTGEAFKATRGQENGVTALQSHVTNILDRTDTSIEGLRKIAYYDSLMGSKFAPSTTLSMNESQLKGEARLIKVSNTSKERPTTLLEMQHTKAIRRACKSGIKMVASMSLFTNSNARIHFVLDGMGDLGKVAQKKPLKDDASYVSITSSELTYCFRNWHGPLNLSQKVYFYVNAMRVPAPWEDSWYLTDGRGGRVESNYPMWHRYALKREVTKGKV